MYMYQTTVQCMTKTNTYIVLVHVPNYNAMHGKDLHIYSTCTCTKLRTRLHLSLVVPEDPLKMQTVQKQLENKLYNEKDHQSRSLPPPNKK